MTDTARLDRIEGKIDKLNDVLTAVARMEEKLIAVDKETEFITQRLLRKETKLIELEKKVDKASSTLSVLTRVFWIVLSALIPAFVGSVWVYGEKIDSLIDKEVRYERTIDDGPGNRRTTSETPLGTRID